MSPGGFTLRRLDLAVINGPRHRIFFPVCWAHSDPDFTVDTYAAAAKTLDCEAAAIEAVARVETSKAPWDAFGRPTILFERHLFSRNSGRLYDPTHPDISAILPTPPGHFGPTSKQHDRLRRAAMLDETAALKSASWGIFQILGKNHVHAGYAIVEAFVDGMMESKQRQLDAFVTFVKADPLLLAALQDKDWPKFASGYNGRNYVTAPPPHYDARMEAAYKRASNAAQHAPASATARPSGLPR